MNHNNHRVSSIENPVIYVPIGPCIYVPIKHYICREPSTNQPFLCKTNPILSAVGGLQMNLKSCYKSTYEKQCTWTLGQNKPNSNPKQTQFAERVKLMQSVYLQRIMKKNAAKGHEKTKPRQTQFRPNQTLS